MKKTVILTSVIASIFLAGSAVASESLTDEMKSKFPGTPIASANHVDGFSGLVELVIGKNQIFYTNEEGNRLLIGHVFDPKTNTDLTQQRIDDLSSIDYKSLPLKDAITIRKGKGEREVAVFTDPDCPYCKKLEEELKLIDNLTVHIFPYPLVAIHPNSKSVAEAIMCSKDKAKAWTDYMLNGVKPKMDKRCDLASAVDRNVELGTKLGINGTPALIAFNGKIKPGYAPAASLEVWLNENAVKPLAKSKTKVGDEK
jgi:thiol:disulfide interchange protein DsbC